MEAFPKPGSTFSPGAGKRWAAKPTPAWGAASQGPRAVLDLHQPRAAPRLAPLRVCGVLLGGEGKARGKELLRL